MGRRSEDGRIRQREVRRKLRFGTQHDRYFICVDYSSHFVILRKHDAKSYFSDTTVTSIHMKSKVLALPNVLGPE